MNKSFVRICMAFIALMVAEALNAQQVSKEIALQKAQSFISKNVSHPQSVRRSSRQAPKLVLANNSSELYVFNDEANGGYVVVSGDERMPDVLAYSDNGLYDADNLPCNMKAWMEEYAAKVAYLREHPEAKVTKRVATERHSISPMLTCWFSQWTPYNDKCPTVDGKRCPTGCVATAMAQIMYYHQWPKQTSDVIPAYTVRAFKIDMPAIPVTTIKWADMIGNYDNYIGNYTQKQADAISTLMLLCGTSVRMEYGPNESGGYSSDAASAFRHIFGYDDMLEEVYRHYYDSDAWEEIIYDDLNNRRPVFYSGVSEDGGHAFVIDGYYNGYFHVNWGWGFNNSSWVLMTSEDKWEGLTLDHSAIFGIQPAYPDSPNQYAVFDNGKFTLYYDNEMSHRSGIVISHRTDWENYKKDVTECVIDPSVANINYKNLRLYFDGWSKLESIKGIENLNTSGTIDMRYMFRDCSSLTSLDLSGLKTDNVTNMASMFEGCTSLTSLDVTGFNTDNVTDMSRLFYGCSGLTNLDVTGFNTDNVTNMASMFSGCSGLTSLDVSSFNTDNVTNMSRLFYGCSGLTNLDVTGFNTDNVTNMASMFSGCSGLTSLDVSSFNTDNVTDMDYMFSRCSGLTSLDVSSFNTDNVTNMAYMFNGCSGLTSLDVSGFNTDNVTNMAYMFSRCSGLTSIDVSGFNTANVTNMSRLFYNCFGLSNLDVSGFNTTNVTNMFGMFMDCSGLTSLDMGGFNTANATNMRNMFDRCSSLTSLDLTDFNTDNVTDMRNMFDRCYNLTTIYVCDKWNMANVKETASMFSQCVKLVGGAGTIYDNNHIGGEYAHVDEGPENPGYFTYKESTAILPIEVDGDSGDIYSLSGVRIGTKDAEGLKPGLYIVKGKKLVVK